MFENIGSSFVTNSEERIILRERRIEQENMKIEFEREERRKDREASRLTQSIYAAILAQALTGGNPLLSNQPSRQVKRYVTLQYYPEEGSVPFPVATSFESLTELMR